jgi:large subunit ribosomal protein L9
MKVILTRDVKDTGRAHDTVTVSDGFALNFLIPKRMAVPATMGNSKQADNRKKASVAQRALDAELVRERLTALSEGSVVIKKKVNEKGHLYDGVDAAEIAAAAMLPEEVISIEKPFKEIGTFEIPVVYGENFGKISITIEGE